MTATAAQKAQLRRMVNEPDTTTYSDEDIATYIENFPLLDELGEVPYYYVQTRTTPTKTDNTKWIPTYDLNAAAADIWEEKAATMQARYNFSADGGSYNVSDAFKQAKAMAMTYRARRAVKTIRMYKTPEEPTGERPDWIVNLPEEKDFGGIDG